MREPMPVWIVACYGLAIAALWPLDWDEFPLFSRVCIGLLSLISTYVMARDLRRWFLKRQREKPWAKPGTSRHAYHRRDAD